VLALHGAGGNGGRVIRPLQEFARTTGAVLLAPTSTGTSWDLMRGGIGPDVQSVDKALRHVFRRYAIDARRVAVYGFSDGASYALTLGTANGDLFSSVIALSPGGYAVASPRGQPEIFIAHGTNDRALPIESTSEVIVRPVDCLIADDASPFDSQKKRFGNPTSDGKGPGSPDGAASLRAVTPGSGKEQSLYGIFSVFGIFSCDWYSE